jgi:hypothetical protein
VLATTPYGVQRDEFLYFSMGEHLRFWRMDFPPAIAVLANLSRAVFDHTLAAVRVFPAVEGTILLLLAGLGRSGVLAILIGVLSGNILRGTSHVSHTGGG